MGQKQKDSPFRRTTAAAVVFAGLFILWEGVTRSGIVPPYILPSISQVVKTAFVRFPEIFPHLLLTLQAVGFGFFLSLGTAFILAVMMHHSKSFRNIFYPLLIFSQTVPLIVLAPLFILWFGFGILPKVLIVVLVCFFPLAVNLLHGLDSVDEDLVNLLRTMGAGRIKILFIVKLPAALDYIFAGLRVAVTYSVIGAVIGEWLGGTEGLGVYMVRAQKAFAVQRVFAAVMYITAVSLILIGIIRILHKAAMPWKQEE